MADQPSTDANVLALFQAAAVGLYLISLLRETATMRRRPFPWFLRQQETWLWAGLHTLLALGFFRVAAPALQFSLPQWHPGFSLLLSAILYVLLIQSALGSLRNHYGQTIYVGPRYLFELLRTPFIRIFANRVVMEEQRWVVAARRYLDTHLDPAQHRNAVDRALDTLLPNIQEFSPLEHLIGKRSQLMLDREKNALSERDYVVLGMFLLASYTHDQEEFEHYLSDGIRAVCTSDRNVLPSSTASFSNVDLLPYLAATPTPRGTHYWLLLAYSATFILVAVFRDSLPVAFHEYVSLFFR